MNKSEQFPSGVSQPKNAEERQAAESFVSDQVLTPEQLAASQEREKFYRQELADTELNTNFLNEQRQRLTPTPEQVKRMDREITGIAALLNGADVAWELDGAINISLYNGEYIGAHKDIDLTIDPEDLEKLENYLGQHGFGLFVSEGRTADDPRGPLTFQRAGAKEYGAYPFHHLIAAIDSSGKIVTGSELNFIDVHLRQRDAKGQTLGHYDVPLPEQWERGKVINWRGQEVHCAHPSKVAYYKFYSLLPERPYDLTDIRRLIDSGVLTNEDLDTIDQQFTKEKAHINDDVDAFVNRMIALVTPEMTYQDLEREFLSDPEVELRVTRGMSADLIRSFAKIMFENFPSGLAAAKQATTKVIMNHVQFEPQESLSALREQLSKINQ